MALVLIKFTLILFTLLYFFLILYLLKGWLRINTFISKKRTFTTKVSILIAARDEEENIKGTIEALLAQDYPKELLEIIIVDDHSSDKTADIIKSYATEGVRLLSLNESKGLNSYKKKAITNAINLSTGELMVATDADCQMGARWLSTIVCLYEEEKPFLISSPVIYFKDDSTFKKLQTLEFLYLIGLGAATIGNQRASTCNGANLAYKKEVFLELGGFQGIDDLASGDDELFLHKVAEKYPEKIAFCKAKDAVVYTEAKETLSAFISQRKRWASKSTHYKKKSIIILGVSVWLFNVILLLSTIVAVFNPQLWGFVSICLAAKIIVELVFMSQMTEFANRSSLLFYLPFLSVLHIIYLIYIGIAGNSGKYQWKGRMVR